VIEIDKQPQRCRVLGLSQKMDGRRPGRACYDRVRKPDPIGLGRLRRVIGDRLEVTAFQLPCETLPGEPQRSAVGASSLPDLTIHPLISLGFSSFLGNTKRNNISMLHVAKTSSPTGC